MGWLYIAVAGLLEVAWACGMKAADGFTRLVPSLLTVAGIVVSMLFLSLGTRTLPIGTAYAVWVGIGAVGTAAVGILFLGEPAGILRVGCLALLIVAIAGLKVVG